MKLHLKTITGTSMSTELDPSSTIEELKQKVSEEFNTPIEKIRLIYNSKILDNSKTIEEIGIEEGKTILVHVQNVPINQKKAVAQVAQRATEKPKEEPKPAPEPKKEEQKSVPEQTKATGKSEKPEAIPLPFVEERSQLVDPPNFDEMVEGLVAMGFEPADCRKALRAAVYNPNRAAEFLLTNYIPDLPHLYDPEEDDGEFNEEEEYDDEEKTQEELEREAMNQFMRALTKNPEFLPDYLEDLATNNPAVAPLIRSDPAAFLVSLGLNPKDFDLTKIKTKKSDYEIYMEQFTEAEQQAIHRLEKHGFDTMTIIQVFDACGRDEALTAECLQGMK